jgi:hypothetical protein
MTQNTFYRFESPPGTKYSLCRGSTLYIERTLHLLWDLGRVSGKFSLTAGVKVLTGGPGNFIAARKIRFLVLCMGIAV